MGSEMCIRDRLFVVDDPDQSDADYEELVNPDSLHQYDGFVENSLRNATIDQRFQFEREGYFCLDSKLSCPDNLVFNRVVSLRDAWAKIEKKSA